jgi:hypothetical protein
LENLFGRDVWSEFIKQNPEDLLEIKRKFEAKKRGLTAQPTETSGESENPPTIKIVPITPLCLLFLTNMSFTWAIMESVVCLKNSFIISGSNKTYIEKRQVKSIQEGIEKSRYSQTVKVAKEKLRFDPEIMKEFFKQTTDSIIAPYVRGHIRSLINSGLCPYITAPLRTAATASLGQITFNLENSDFTLSYKSGESENHLGMMCGVNS